MAEIFYVVVRKKYHRYIQISEILLALMLTLFCQQAFALMLRVFQQDSQRMELEWVTAMFLVNIHLPSLLETIKHFYYLRVQSFVTWKMKHI